eukprot:Skav228914  [mRNA]  locus=scaffold2504:52236:66837:+ [translate_table: standard]
MAASVAVVSDEEQPHLGKFLRAARAFEPGAFGWRGSPPATTVEDYPQQAGWEKRATQDVSLTTDDGFDEDLGLCTAIVAVAMPPAYAPARGSHEFIRLVERTTNALVTKDDGELEEVKKALIQVHQQFDQVHEESEAKQARLNRLREEIRTADQQHVNKGDWSKKMDETWKVLSAQYKEVALSAANDAFETCAGRLRKLYAIEKLSGRLGYDLAVLIGAWRFDRRKGTWHKNFLQKTTFEQVERSQSTEDNFQKIRDVTGLADVMDIVHKFLNRDVEQDTRTAAIAALAQVWPISVPLVTSQ